MRKRFWLGAIIGVSSSLLFVMTLCWPDWIEICFGIDPDSRNGSLESLILLSIAVVALTAFTFGTVEYKRTCANKVTSSDA